MAPHSKRILKWSIIGLVILFFLGFFFDIVFVFNSRAHVDVTTSNGFLSPGSHTKTYPTNVFGFAFVPLSFPSEVSVVDDQYELTKSGFYGFLKIGPFVFVDIHKGLQRPIAILNQFMSPHPQFQSNGTNNGSEDKFDALSYIINDGKSSEEYDFEIQAIDSNREKIVFTGDGGIQSSDEGVILAASDEYKYGGTSGTEEKSKKELIAPVDGYQKEMEIVCGQKYVARLRDGKHYMKIFYYPPEGDLEQCGNKYLVTLMMYIQPVETRNLSFTNLSWYFVKDLEFGPNYQ